MPHKALTPIVGFSAFEAISTARLQLNVRSNSAHAHHRNKKIVPLHLTAQLEDLDALSSVKFALPTSPCQHPTMKETATVPKITNIRRSHKNSSTSPYIVISWINHLRICSC